MSSAARVQSVQFRSIWQVDKKVGENTATASLLLLLLSFKEGFGSVRSAVAI